MPSFKFTQSWTQSGCIIASGVVIRGEFEITEGGVSKIGSNLLKNIPCDILEEYIDPVYEKKQRIKKKKELKQKKTANESARISDRVDLLKL